MGVFNVADELISPLFPLFPPVSAVFAHTCFFAPSPPPPGWMLCNHSSVRSLWGTTAAFFVLFCFVYYYLRVLLVLLLLLLQSLSVLFSNFASFDIDLIESVCVLKLRQHQPSVVWRCRGCIRMTNLCFQLPSAAPSIEISRRQIGSSFVLPTPQYLFSVLRQWWSDFAALMLFLLCFFFPPLLFCTLLFPSPSPAPFLSRNLHYRIPVTFFRGSCAGTCEALRLHPPSVS